MASARVRAVCAAGVVVALPLAQVRQLLFARNGNNFIRQKGAQMSFDTKCAELARAFLADVQQETNELLVKELSQEIQDVIEAFLENLNSRSHTTTSAGKEG